MLRLAILVFLVHAGVALAEGRRDSACLAMSEGEARVIPAAFGASLEAETVRIRLLGHASFALETAGGTLAVTDYTGYIGNPDVVPDVVTMNIAHDTHFTDTPDPRIPVVLRGWGNLGLPAVIDAESGDLRGLLRDPAAALGGAGHPDAHVFNIDLIQAGLEGNGSADVILQSAQLLPGLEIGLLRDVLAGLHVAGDRQRDRGDGVLAGVDDAAIGFLAAARGGGQFGLQHQVQGDRIHGVRLIQWADDPDGPVRPM